MLIFGHCTEHMRLKIESHQDYQNMRGDIDVLLLVANIKGITFKSDGHKHPSQALHEAKLDL